MIGGRWSDFLSNISEASPHRKNLPGYLGTILSGRLSISMISLLTAELLNPLFQTPPTLGNALTIIAVGVVQKEANVRPSLAGQEIWRRQLADFIIKILRRI